MKAPKRSEISAYAFRIARQKMPFWRRRLAAALFGDGN